jgi:thiol:disulfide interchange protein DsbD
MKKSCLLVFVFSLFLINTTTPKVTCTHKRIDQHVTELTFSFDMPEGDFVYQDYLDISCANPDLKIAPFTVSSKSLDQYDPRFKENKKHLTQPFKLTCIAQHDAEITEPIRVNVSYFQNSNKQIVQELFTIVPQAALQTSIDAAEKMEEAPAPVPSSSAYTQCETKKLSWSESISNLITDTDSLALRILLVILLGILMSLTPCIYPMIPITVGILQSQAGTSVTRNFMRAIAYTMGIATTFAFLGLLAAFTGQVFGSIMVNPIFICSIVLVLLYLAGSMLGLYEMYIPPFMQPKNNGMQGNSLLAAFLFGAASGTMASPCLSPGLVLLLTLVTTLANKFMGFLLLFSFGIGLSIPLLLIGTFSSSLNVLPKSGMWMVEIKRAFGLIMIMMCFYFLNNILPWHILLWIISVFSLIAGIFYLSTLAQTHSSSGKYVKNILSVSLISASVFIASQAFKATIEQQRADAICWWQNDYKNALEQAKENKKLVFLDVTAPYCSICKAIDSKLFTSALVREKISSFAVPVKIDIAKSNDDATHLREKFAIIGVPVFIVLSPENEEVIARWGGELYEYSVEDFVQLLGGMGKE